MSNEKIKLREKIGYGFGDAASSMFWKLFGMYLMFFYTDVFGITAAAAGLMMIVTRAGDAVIDPLIGIMGDRTNTRWGKFRPYLLWIAIPFGIIGVLTFTTPNFSPDGKLVYAYITFSLMMIIYSMINVPYASLMGVMTADGKMRTTLATFRFIFAFGGSFLVLGLYQPLFDRIGTRTFNEFSSTPKEVVVNDTITKSSITYYVYDSEIKDSTVTNPVDSLLFLTTKANITSKEPFSIGVLNPSTNTYYKAFDFEKNKDTLGVVRTGATCELTIKLSTFTGGQKLSDLKGLKLAVSGPAAKDLKLNKLKIKEIDYKSGIQKAVMIIALLAILFFILTFSWTRERIKPIQEKTSLKNDLKDLVHNGPWFIMLGAGLSTIFFNTIRDGAAVYYFTYYYQGVSNIELSSATILAISTIYLLIGQAANIVGVVLAKPISDKIGKKKTFLIAMINAALLSIVFFWSSRTDMIMIFILQFLISVNAGIIFPLVWSMYADTADYSEDKNGRRATGLVFSAASMSQKGGAALGMWALGLILTAFGYKAGVEQSESTLHGLRMMLSIIPAAGATLAAIFMFIYPLSEKKMSEIETRLAERRAAVSEQKTT